MNIKNITIKDYLNYKGISFKQHGKELVTHCLFGNCDKNRGQGAGHLYFNTETGQYDCKKCGEYGNMWTLAIFFGDKKEQEEEVVINLKKPEKKIDDEIVLACYKALPDNIRKYLNDRGISNAIVDEYKLGWSKFYGKWWITIPIKDTDGTFQFFKLRQNPDEGKEKRTYPKGTEEHKVEAQIYDWNMLNNPADKIVICEGEMDRLLLVTKGVVAVTGTHGAGTFKEEWVEKIVDRHKKVYICYDNDDAGRNGAEKVAKMLKGEGRTIFIITLPKEVGEGGDVTDYFIKLNGNTDDLFNKYAKEYPEKIDTSQFQPISTEELLKILGLTIKKDEENKLITFLCELSAYTEDSQFNISFNAPSSTGKSYIPTEIAKLLPEEDVIETGYCSPTAFFHDNGVWDKENKKYTIDLSRKVLIFLDQPHTQLLERLRPLLSHDKKEIGIKVTDKTQKFGMKTKNIILRGFPSVIFCTAGLKIDEQEGTRFLLLSPETSQEKIREAIYEKIKKETNACVYKEQIDNDPKRKMLIERIRAIKQEDIKEIKISSAAEINERFFNKNKKLKSRHTRDIGRIISIIKSSALLNLWFRERNGSTIIANKNDIEDAFKIWEAISESQELNLPPYIFNLYKEIIMPIWNEKNQITEIGATNDVGIMRQEIVQRNYQINGRLIPDWQLRLHIIPMLENAGLIRQEADPVDKRKILIYPTPLLNIFDKQNNSESDGGVK